MTEHGRPQGEQRLLDQLLEHLKRNSDDERLRELAAGVLNGDVTLSKAVTADAYAESLNPHLATFGDWYQQLDSDALAEQIKQSQDRIDKLSDGT